ncbi:binding-protein-dependent transport systems inner membrane component [Denitrovibrio acetiphilus DSM 12809]|uniref:Binding-protein-dependent transport systems inner membrane component n=1 Tax=Denitrovibrio acetiphilus (strain DSM 12809 / NBRC 114555 / N2460) TaxID=522772 RepID=D4H1T3_DENA2|nr:methionine ABC transporter permease [Denitrovibrio acetiphilus]ADD68843.1 binding-protein-dependent transport systems inner membrane component [Denitrovibrio acetiphilus DSM 12809]
MNYEYFNNIIGLLWPSTVETLYMVVASCVLAYIIGLPVGVLLVVSSEDHILPAPWVERVLGTLINILRSAPFIVLMVALIPFTRIVAGTSIGTTAAIVPLVVASAPFVARIVESSLKEVSHGVIEAAESMGASTFQIIFKVLLPESKSSLILGAAITVINVIGYTAMAGAVGGGGLGDLAIQYGYNRFRTDIMIVTVAILIIFVQLVQTFGTRLAVKLSHKN